MTREKRSRWYRYVESGLDNVYIQGVKTVVDDVGNEVHCIPNVGRLHKVIAHSIIAQASRINGKELRFLRTEMGFTQEEIAKLLKMSRATVNRWETGKERIDSNAEMFIRVLSAERLDIDLNMSIENMARECGWATGPAEIRIDGTDPEAYRPIAA